MAGHAEDLGFEAFRAARERFLERLRIDAEIRRIERSLAAVEGLPGDAAPARPPRDRAVAPPPEGSV